ncbi:MAG: hypothetical protein JWM14_2985 [Chitinophagaceae bacterium]|jgi:hypothetical protein|nr:hypothetical protein [Chitinophagaceae bacterium]
MRVDFTDRLSQLGYSPAHASIAYDNFINSLKSDETILYLMEGSIKNTLGVIVATDKRIYYIGVNKHKNILHEHISYNDIVFITGKESPWTSMEIKVKTETKYDELVIRGCEIDTGKEFIELIRLLTIKPED